VVGRRSGAAGAAYAAALGAVLIAACPPSGAAADVRPPRAQYDISVEARFRFRFATDGQLPLLAGYAAAVISSVDWFRRPSSRCCAGRGARRNRRNPRGTRVFADSRRGTSPGTAPGERADRRLRDRRQGDRGEIRTEFCGKCRVSAAQGLHCEKGGLMSLLRPGETGPTEAKWDAISKAMQRASSPREGYARGRLRASPPVVFSCPRGDRPHRSLAFTAAIEHLPSLAWRAGTHPGSRAPRSGTPEPPRLACLLPRRADSGGT
jgi:hypothetical protein